MALAISTAERRRRAPSATPEPSSTTPVETATMATTISTSMRVTPRSPCLSRRAMTLSLQVLDALDVRVLEVVAEIVRRAELAVVARRDHVDLGLGAVDLVDRVPGVVGALGVDLLRV